MIRLKHYTITLLGIMTMMLTGCSESLLEPGWEKTEGQPVSFTMSVNLPGAPAATRAMDGTTTPTITSLYVVVFGQDHFLRELAKAEEVDDFETESAQGRETKFNVTLNTSAEPVIVHLIANYDLSAGLSFGSEGQLIGTIETSDNSDIYWQRVDGVTIQAPVGTKEIEAPTNLQQVPLVRNYAQFDLKFASSIDNFELTRFALVNMPDRGSIAPRISGNDFANYYDGSGISATCKKYQDIIAQRYYGNEPYTSVLNTYDTENTAAFKWINASDANNNAPTQFVYEYNHDFDSKHPLSLLVAGKYGTDTDETYYKLDITYQDDAHVSHYYNILRNFKYTMNITEVKAAGYRTPEEALAHVASNNISGATEIEDYNSISDGTYRLYVDKSTIYIVNTNQVTFKYRLIKMSDNTSANNRVSISWDATDVGDDGTAVPTHAFKTAPTSTTTDDSDGWRTVTITPNDPSRLTLDLTGKIYVAEESGLMRTVTVILRQPYRMLVEVTPENVTQTYNYPVTVSTFIPNDLPQSIFPLEFHYGTDGNSIYPQANTDMPVKISGQGTYGFVKTIRWEDYEILPKVTKTMQINGQEETVTMRQIDALFMTNTQTAGSKTVTVSNDFFTPASDNFVISTQTAIISNIGIVGSEYYGEGHSLTLKYTLSSRPTTLSITLTDGNKTSTYTVSNADLNVGSHQVSLKTLTFKDDVSFTITATTGANTQTITIKNPKKRHILLVPAGSFRINDTSVLGNYAIEREDDGNDGYKYSWSKATNWQEIDYEWPDYHVDGIASGSGRIWGPASTTPGTQNLIEIDATYGGRVQDFEENSEFVFTTYYNYNAAYATANTATEAEYFSGEHAMAKKYAVLKVGDICKNWADNGGENGGYIDLELEFSTTLPASMGGTGTGN